MGLCVTQFFITFILYQFRDIKFLPSILDDIPLVLPILYVLYNIDRTTKYGRKISAAFVWAVLADILSPKSTSLAQLAVFCRSIQFIRAFYKDIYVIPVFLILIGIFFYTSFIKHLYDVTLGRVVVTPYNTLLKIGIVVYSAISVSMAVVGGSRSINPTNISRTSKIYGAVGAILLVVSDGMYMLQKYDKQLPHYEMLWAITYYSGLSFLGATAWKKVNRPESKLAPMECDVIAPTLQQSIPINSKSLIVEAGAVGEKHNVAICFSGGGQRAYATALGIMNALMKNDRGVNYLQKFRYMTGVEGGSWATVAAAYSPHQDDMAGFIGNYVSPNSMTVGYMKGVSKEGAYDNRSLRSHGTISSLYYYAIRCVFAPAANMGNKWAYAASTTYLPHLGDKVTKNFTCNVETANELIKCNPQLALDDFVWPNNEDFAFPIVQCALDRPSGYAYARRPDESFKQRDLSNIEISPAYIGNLVVRNALYFGNQTHVTGGMIRPYEFTIKAPISATKDRSMLCFETNTINSTPYMNLRRAIGLSSYAPGLLVDNARSRLPIVQHFRDTFESFPMFYWSPSSYPKPVSREYLFCDGGILENVMLIAMLQRKVKHIVLCFGTKIPLSEYLSVANPHPEEMACDLACYFGVDLDTKMDHKSCNYYNNQVFAKSDYSKLVNKLVAKKKSGDAVVVELNLTTIANERWGIEAGFDVHLVVLYTHRASKWDKQLPKETYDLIYEGKTSFISRLFGEVAFSKGFPNLPTVTCGLIPAEVNALANFSGWMVKENMHIFDKLFDNSK